MASNKQRGAEETGRPPVKRAVEDTAPRKPGATGSSNRGFASTDPERQLREVAGQKRATRTAPDSEPAPKGGAARKGSTRA